MKPKAQLLLLAGLLATAVILLACLPAQEGVGSATTPGPDTGTPPSAIDALPTPSLLTPTPAADAGRPDCPQDSAAYQDPDGQFSVCYPADWIAKGGVAEAYFGRTLTLLSMDTPEGLAVGEQRLSLYWSESSAFHDGLIESYCATAELQWQDVAEIQVAIGDREVAACPGDAADYGHPDPDGVTPLRGTHAEFPVAAGGYLVFDLIEGGGSSNIGSDPLSTILQSLRAGQ